MLWLPPNYRELRINISQRYVPQLEAYIDQGCLIVTHQNRNVANVVDLEIKNGVWLTLVESRKDFFTLNNIHLESYTLGYIIDKDTDKLLSVLTLEGL